MNKETLYLLLLFATVILILFGFNVYLVSGVEMSATVEKSEYYQCVEQCEVMHI